MNTRREHQPEPGSDEEARAIREEWRKRELELEAMFHNELAQLLNSELLSEKDAKRARRILYHDAIGVRYAQPFIGLLLHATHLPSKKGICETTRHPSVAKKLLKEIFYELESFIEDPREDEWLKHKRDGDGWNLGPLEKLFQRIHDDILRDVPVVGID